MIMDNKKKIAWIFFVVNTVLILMSMAKEINGFAELIFFILGIVALWGIIVKSSDKAECSADRIPVILFLDSMVFLVVKASDWIYLVNAYNAAYFLTTQIAGWIIFAVVGFLLFVLGVKKSSKIVQFFAFEAWMFSLVYMLGNTIINFWYSSHTLLMVLLFTIANIIWCYLVKWTSLLNPNRKSSTTILALGFLGKFVFLLLFCQEYIALLFSSFTTSCLGYAGTLLRTRNIVIFMIFILVVAVGILGRQSDVSGHRVKAVMSIAGFVCVLKASMVFYVPGGFVMLFIYMGWMNKDLSKRKLENDCIRTRNDILEILKPWILSTTLVLILFLISNGLWVLALLGIILGWITMRRIRKDVSKVYAMIIVFSAIMAFVAMLTFKYQLEYLIVIALILIGMLVMYRFASYPHPSVDMPKKIWKTGICAASIFLFTVLIVHNGSHSIISYDSNNYGISSEVSVRNRSANLNKISYQ